jgi:opacity protein-like surface antigen
VALGSSPALAGDFYLSGRIGIASTSAEGSGVFVTENQPPAIGSGAQTDASPLLGAALGYGATFDEALPWDFGISDWSMRLEFEGLAGHDNEYITPSAITQSPIYVAQVNSWTFMTNFWLDVPIHRPLSALFGRIRILEPVSLYGGVGIGFVSTSLDVDAPFNETGSNDEIKFAWQAGVGAGYDVTERVNINLGYRYLDLGSILADFGDPSGIFTGHYEVSQTSNQFVVGIRVNFWEIGFPGSKRFKNYQ